MKITIGEIIKKAIDTSETVVINPVNRNLMEINKSNKKRHGFLKVAVTDEICDSMFDSEKSPIGLMIFIDRDIWDKIKEESEQ